MVFYLEPKGCQLNDYFLDHGKLIGVLNIQNSNLKTIEKTDISLEEIHNHYRIKEVLVVNILFLNWPISIIAVNSDAFNLIKTKFKKCGMFWYWMPLTDVKECVSSMTFDSLISSMKE